MNQSLVSLALIIIAGACLVAYLIGFSAGKDEGHDEGREKGKKEGAVRAFAVGYDRGKREREPEEDEGPAESGPRPFILLLVVLATVLLLAALEFLRQRG